MASETVNEDLMIVTQGSDHVADSEKPTDECLLIDKTTVKGFRNYIKTSACSNKEATQKTFIRSARIIHSESRIGQTHGWVPSFDDDFSGWGGGINNGNVFFRHANDLKGSHSKNVKVEGKWIVRTNDETEQNNANCKGKFVEGDGGISEEDLEALLSKGCTIESVTMKCEHRETNIARLSVLEGDKVTITAVHVNDAEVEKEARAKPQCQVPRRKKEGKLPEDAKEHVYYRVTRSAYPATSWRDAFPALTKEITGIEITLESEWLGEAPEEEGIDPGDDGKVIHDSDEKLGIVRGAPSLEGARMMRDQRNNPAQTPEQATRGRAEVDAALQRDMENRSLREDIANRNREGMQQRRDREEAREEKLEKGREKTESVLKSAGMILTTYAALKEVFFAKPIEIKVEALACAGAKPVTIAAYPPGAYSINLLELKEFKTAFIAIKDAITKIRSFLELIDGAKAKEEGAGAEGAEAEGADAEEEAGLAINAGRFTITIWILKDITANLSVQFRELTRDSTADEAPGRKKHEVHRAFSLELASERLIGIQFAYSIPVTYVLGAFGAVAQKFLDNVGADLSFKFEVELSASLRGAFTHDEYGKFVWLETLSSDVIAKFTISLNASLPGAAVSIGVTAVWKPTFVIRPTSDQPMEVRRITSNIEIKWFINAAIDIFGWTVDLEYEGNICDPIQLGAATYALS